MKEKIVLLKYRLDEAKRCFEEDKDGLTEEDKTEFIGYCKAYEEIIELFSE